MGAAPGVGKTYAMLAEARRRLARGTDVVAGLVETHGRGPVAELLADIETVPRATRTYRGTRFTDLDLDALLARRPAVALVDELAHTNVPGSRNQKRWQDVEELIAAGIDVLSTVNIQHLESLNEVVEAVTGIPQRETVPDDVVRRAEQVQLVDMTPEALRRRMAHGNIYPPEQIDAALGNYFRVGNLAAARELALLWMADKVDEQIDEYRAQHGISRRWETRERVVVALTGGPEGDTVIRRAARVAGRAAGGELLAVHVTRSDGLLSTDAGALQRQRELVESLGGSYHQVVGPDVPDALLDFARAENASQLVLGASRRSWLGTLFGGRGVAAEVTRRSGQLDVHMVPHDFAGRGRRLPGLSGGLSRRRRLALERRRLSQQAADAAGQAATDRTRSALLAAVSHDLRTPLASAKAAVDSLRSADVVWSSQDQAELLATAEESLDRLVRLVENLIDTSQLRAGALTVAVRAVGLDDLVALVLDQLGPLAARVRFDVPAAVPVVSADPELLRRVVANLVTNAIEHSPADQPPLVTASAVGERVELRVVDRGSGIPAADWERVFVPFQRLGDRDNTTGVGLGLALARGLAEAMGGTLTPEDTPGGGLTMVLALPAAADWTP